MSNAHPNSLEAIRRSNAKRSAMAKPCPRCGGKMNRRSRKCLGCGRAKQMTLEQKRTERWLRNYGRSAPGWYLCLVRLGRGYGKAIEAKKAKPKKDLSRKAPFSCDDEMVGEMLKRNPGKINLKASWPGIVWSARYWLDDNYRASEIARTQAKEAVRWRCPDDGTLTGAVVQRLFANAKDCHWCGMPMHPRDKTMDHLTPLSKGGVHGLHNVVVACLKCNVRRGARVAA